MPWLLDETVSWIRIDELFMAQVNQYNETFFYHRNKIPMKIWNKKHTNNKKIKCYLVRTRSVSQYLQKNEAHMALHQFKAILFKYSQIFEEFILSVVCIVRHIYATQCNFKNLYSYKMQISWRDCIGQHEYAKASY